MYLLRILLFLLFHLFLFSNFSLAKESEKLKPSSKQKMMALDYFKMPVEFKGQKNLLQKHMMEVFFSSLRYQFVIGDVDLEKLKGEDQLDMITIVIGREVNSRYFIKVVHHGNLEPNQPKKVHYVRLEARQVPLFFRLALYELIWGKEATIQSSDLLIQKAINELQMINNPENKNLSSKDSGALPVLDVNSSNRKNETIRLPELPSLKVVDVKSTLTSTSTPSQKTELALSATPTFSRTATVSGKVKSQAVAPLGEPILNIKLNDNEVETSMANIEDDDFSFQSRTGRGRFIYDPLPESMKKKKSSPPAAISPTETTKNQKVSTPPASFPENSSITKSSINEPLKLKFYDPKKFGINVVGNISAKWGYHTIDSDWTLKTRTNYSMKGLEALAVANLIDDTTLDYRFKLGFYYISAINSFSGFVDKEWSIGCLAKDSLSKNIDSGISLESSSFYFAGSKAYGEKILLVKNSFFWIAPEIRYRLGSDAKNGLSGNIGAVLARSVWSQSDSEGLQIGATRVDFDLNVRFRREEIGIQYEYLSFSGQTQENSQIKGTGSKIRFTYTHWFL